MAEATPARDFGDALETVLRIVVENIRAYEIFFFEKLSRLPGIQEINSIVVFSEIKATTALPLGQGHVG